MDGYQEPLAELGGMSGSVRYMLLHDRKQIAAEHLAELTQLINDAYRGISGSGRWTTEHHLVDGDRISMQDLGAALEDPMFEMLIARDAEQQAENQILACIAVKQLNLESIDAIYEFGTFAVRPELQGSGLGKSMLLYAENWVRSRCSTSQVMFQVVVVEANRDLVRFYQKRGYQLVGESIAYPVHLNVGIPKRNNLDLVVLRKPA